MRSHGKHRTELDPKDVFCDLATLICDKRRYDTSDKQSTSSKQSRLSPCDSLSKLCCNAREEACKLWVEQLPFCLQVFLTPNDCNCDNSSCGGEVLLERWTIETLPRRNHQSKPIIGELLVQAVRSHLGFSQLSAWMSIKDHKLSFKIGHRLCLPGDVELLDDTQSLQPHNFPVVSFGKSHILAVKVLERPRMQHPPIVFCVPMKMQQLVNDQLASSAEEGTHEQMRENTSTPTQCADDDRGKNSFLYQSSHSPTATSDLSRNSSLSTDSEFQAPVTNCLSSTPSSSCSRENPLFCVDGCIDIQKRMQAVNLTNSTSPRSRQKQKSGGSDRPLSPVRFYFCEKEEEYKNGKSCTPGGSGVPKSPSKVLRRRERRESGGQMTSHRHSRKILYSTDEDVCFVSPESPTEEPFDSWNMMEKEEEDVRSCSKGERSRWDVHRKTSFTEGSSDNTHRNKNIASKEKEKPVTRAAKVCELPSLTSRFLRRSVPSADLGFSRLTGLPLNSSPAPLKRNQHSFDFDSSLNSVAQIRNALYNEHDSGSSDSECGGTSLCKSAPASTNLLGNFEESALNGRIKPFGSVQGFILDLAASGAFCPPHATLPVTTFFFQVSEDNAPSPYLGHCSLDPLGKKGYHLPKKGTVQATLFNPQQTVVKMFVVRYDLADMPPLCQTFVRQRTYLMPANATREDARKNTSWLRYLIHLRLSTSRSGKLYLHTNIRMLFSRKSALDGNACDVSVADDLLLPSSLAPSFTQPAISSESCELRSFTEMPKNPKFSPRKLGRFSAKGSEEQID